MTLSKETQETIYAARKNSPELDRALDEVQDVIIGVLGVTNTAGNLERPLNDTEEHKDINEALDSCRLASLALQAVYDALSA